MIAIGVGGFLVRGFLEKLVEAIMSLVGRTCSVFLSGFLLCYGAFLVVVHVCFYTHVARVVKLLLWCINVPMSVVFFAILGVNINIKLCLRWVLCL